MGAGTSKNKVVQLSPSQHKNLTSYPTKKGEPKTAAKHTPKRKASLQTSHASIQQAHQKKTTSKDDSNSKSPLSIGDSMKSPSSSTAVVSQKSSTTTMKSKSIPRKSNSSGNSSGGENSSASLKGKHQSSKTVANLSPKKSKPHSALIIIGMQNDFISGNLRIGHNPANVISRVNTLRRCYFSTIVVIQRSHPKNHVSFASQHPQKEPFDTVNIPNPASPGKKLSQVDYAHTRAGDNIFVI